MADLKTLHLAHLPTDLAVHVALFQNLKNAAFLRRQLLDGNADFEYALIDASVIVSTEHILAAVFRAANDYLNRRLKSHNVHSEIVFALSPNNNVSLLSASFSEPIAESFRRFGITDTTTDLIVIKLSTSSTITHDSVKEHLASTFKGEMIDFCDESLAQKADLMRIRKIYKLNQTLRTAGKYQQQKAMSDLHEVKADVAQRELEISILGLMALRGAG